MSYQNGLCPHGHRVVSAIFGARDWIVERRPVEVCPLCREQDDGRPLHVYIQHPAPGDEPRSVAFRADGETTPISVAAGMTGGAA